LYTPDCRKTLRIAAFLIPNSTRNVSKEIVNEIKDTYDGMLSRTNLIQNRTDAILRKVNLDCYDDRDDIRVNLIESLITHFQQSL
jgi:hypothetical protein